MSTGTKVLFWIKGGFKNLYSSCSGIFYSFEQIYSYFLGLSFFECVFSHFYNYNTSMD